MKDSERTLAAAASPPEQYLMREAIKGVIRGHQRQSTPPEQYLMREAIKGVIRGHQRQSAPPEQYLPSEVHQTQSYALTYSSTK